MDIVFDVIVKLCEWLKNVIESGSVFVMFARGVIFVAFYALFYDSFVWFMVFVCGGSDVCECVECVSWLVEIYMFRCVCLIVCGVFIVDVEDVKFRVFAWFVVEVLDAIEFNFVFEDVVECYCVFVIFVFGFVCYYIVVIVYFF